MNDDYETSRLMLIVQSYFSEKIAFYKKNDKYYVEINGRKTNVLLTSNYKDVVMNLYLESGKVDPRAMDTIKSLME